MRPLLIFIAGLLLVFGALAVFISASRSTERVFVVVDSSFPMRAAWRQVPAELDAIDDQSYSEFALATEKGLIHSWQERLRFRETSTFAPCDFSRLEDYAEAGDADVRILITTSASCPTDALADWSVITLDP